MKRSILLIALGAAVLAGCNAPKPVQEAAHVASSDIFVLPSPDEVLYARIYLDTKGTPVYELNRADTKVMLPSALGFELRGTVKYTGLEYHGSEILKPDVEPP